MVAGREHDVARSHWLAAAGTSTVGNAALTHRNGWRNVSLTVHRDLRRGGYSQSAGRELDRRAPRQIIRLSRSHVGNLPAVARTILRGSAPRHPAARAGATLRGRTRRRHVSRVPAAAPDGGGHYRPGSQSNRTAPRRHVLRNRRSVDRTHRRRRWTCRSLVLFNWVCHFPEPRRAPTFAAS
jgi:hypothetical protein